MENTQNYKNSDGFSIEKTSYGIKFYDSMAYDNADGGWDDKSFRPYYENIISLRNKRNFRFWNDTAWWSGDDMGTDITSGPIRMKNILTAYTRDLDYSNPGVHTKTSIEIDGATFYNNFDSPVHVENAPTAKISISNSILWRDECPDELLILDGSNTNEIVFENNYTCQDNATLELKNPHQDWKDGDDLTGFDPVDQNIDGYRGRQ